MIAITDTIPDILKQLVQWVCWILSPDPKGGKPKKVPINPRTGKAAKPNDPSTWTDYQTAVSAAEKYGYSGIGFMLAEDDGFVVVDIDHCYDPQTKSFNDVAKAIMGRQDTYAELSPSGDGVHLWYLGAKPGKTSKNTETGVEMYDCGRYLTVTGDILPGATPDIQQAKPDTLTWIHTTYVAKVAAKKKKAKRNYLVDKLTDEEILEKAKNARNGVEFAALMDGNWQGKYASQSEADLALCKMLAFWCAKDTDQMARIFRQSGLFRGKWDEVHSAGGETYGSQTLEKAVDSTQDVYSPWEKSPIFEKDGLYLREKEDTVYQITNFVIRPVEMILGDEETQLTGDFVTTRNETFRLTLLSTDFGNTQRFKAVLNEKTIALAFYSSDSDLELLKTYLSGLEWSKKVGVKAVGIYEHNGKQVFVSGEQSIDADGNPVDGIVQLSKYASIGSTILDADILQADAVKTLCHDLLSYTVPQKAVPILAWTAGCFLKSYLKRASVKFPHLFLIGEAGSGKSTTMERVILPVFSTNRVSASTQVTAFTLMKESASSALIPQALDEFKPSKMHTTSTNALHNHLRDSYDGHKGERGRADQSVTCFDLQAPIVVAGEESAEETAIRDRGIELLFAKKDIREEACRQAFGRITRSESAIRSLGRTLLQVALQTEPQDVKGWYDEGVSKFSPELDSRIINNLACCYAGLRLMEALCTRYNYAWDDVFPYRFGACVRYLEMAAKDYMLDGGTHNQSIVEQTFEIMARMDLYYWRDFWMTPDGKELHLRMGPVYDKYTKYRREYAIQGEVLPFTQFKRQLEKSEFFLEKSVQHKFIGVNERYWRIDFAKLSACCDVTGFVTAKEAAGVNATAPAEENEKAAVPVSAKIETVKDSTTQTTLFADGDQSNQ